MALRVSGLVFHENFSSLIHNNPRLSNAEKIQYLTGCLSGKALIVCSGIPATSENYEIIWNALLEKYQDVRVQASLYLDQMLQFKPNQSIENFIDNFCSAEAALRRRLKIDNLADFIITRIALNKLDRDTVNAFEQAHREVNVPSSYLLNCFLKEQNKINTARNSKG